MARKASLPPTAPPVPLPVDDSAATAPLIVDIARIQSYERNPRHGRNSEYDRIKDSIRHQGLDQPLVITQRPGSTGYIVHAGGNTRLLILKELYEETAEERFARILCVFRPWRRESDVLLAHLRENDLRGNLTFIDKARAVLDARHMFATDLGAPSISLRRLETELGKAGYRISPTSLCLMEYAVERLLELIPQALEAGLGRRQIERVRALERAARSLWQANCSGGDSMFDEVFAALCRRYDAPEWDTDLLQVAIETEIAEDAETSVHTIRVALETELKGRDVVIPEFVPIKEPPISPTRHDNHGSTVTSEGLDDPDEEEPAVNRGGEASVAQAHTRTEPQDNGNGSMANVSQSLINPGHVAPEDLKSLRGRAWTLATRLAQRNGIGDLIVPVSGKGLGFVLRDVPDSVLADQLDEETLAQVCMLWWQLAACSEMTYAPLESIIPMLPADSVLRRALEEEDAELLFSSIWTLDPGHTGYRLWRPLPDRDWRDLLTLMDTYRRIRHLATEAGTALWD